MDYRELSWKGYNWITSERWGEIHPDFPYAYYSQNCVSINSDGDLVLDVKPNTDKKSFIIDDKEVIPQSQIGLVSSTAENPLFKYGDYFWVAKMPKGKHLWPALWMWSWDCWPPEIDVAECWTNDCGGYFKFNHKWKLFQWNCQSNLHVIHSDKNYAETIPILKGNWKDPAEDFNVYMLRWLPNKLQFYYNDNLVRTFDHPGTMDYIDRNTQGGMNVLMNVMVTEDYKDGQMKTPLVIKDFKYVSLSKQ